MPAAIQRLAAGWRVLDAWGWEAHRPKFGEAPIAVNRTDLARFRLALVDVSASFVGLHRDGGLSTSR